MVKVIDFGISKMSTGVDAGMDITKTAEMRGSLLFMSPEQMTSPKSVDPRSDIWSLGVSLHNLLTGTYPFRATTVPELCATILQREPVPLRAVRPDAPAELEVCILRCLHKSPEDRYANVGEFAAALAELAPPSARVAVERIRRLLAMTSRRTQESRPSLTEIEARISTPTVPLAARPLLDEAVDTTPMLREKPAVMAAGETTGSDGKPSSLSSVGASWGSTNPLRGGRSGSYVLLVVAAATLVSAATVSFALLALRQRQSEPATQDGFAPAGVETVIPAPARVPASDREAGASWLMEAPQAVASTAEPAGVSPGSIASGAAPKRAPRSQASSNPSIEEAHAPSFRPAVSSPSRTSPKPSASTDSRVSPEATVQATSTPPPPPPEPNTPSSVPF
jgi:serine/threonine-protein kinase